MVTVDFNQRPLLVWREKIPMAYVGQRVHVVDPDGELEADAIVTEIKPTLLCLEPVQETIRDLP